MTDTKLDSKLNKRERYKARLRPFDYFAEFDSIDFESLGEGDRFYLQDFGIFNAEFTEEEFTLRLRLEGGRISAEQFSFLADIVQEYDLTIILTVRAGVQLHDIQAEDIHAIWKKLNTHGLSSWQSFGDNIRNIVTDVFDGRGKSSKLEVYPIVQNMRDFILKNPRYVGMLPRRVSIGISGNSTNVSSFFANDIYFALAQKDTVYGFNVYLGGKNTDIAQSADIFLLEEEVFDFFKAFVEAFYLHGSRYSRSKTRLRYLIEDIGMDGLKKHIQTQYKREFVSEGTLSLEKAKFEQYETLKDGTFSFCYHTDFSRLTPKEIKEIAAFSLQSGTEIRVGIDQNIYFLGLKEKNAPFNSLIQSSTVVACAGSLCPYAVWSIKDDTSYIPLDAVEKHQIQVGFSGCAKGCGRHHHSDIGLIGLKTNNFGDTDGGARVFVGAQHSLGVSTGRMLFSMVPFVHLKETLSLIISIYEKSAYSNFEEYTKDILNQFSPSFLSLWYLANLESNQSYEIKLNNNPILDTDESFEFEKRYLLDTFPNLESLQNIDDSFTQTVSQLAKKIWSVEGEDPTYKPPMKRVNFR
ncbi:MAG: nitrite/sulfite reductase [Sulfurimonas sp.]